MDCLRGYAVRLQSGEVTVEDLLMVRRISQQPEEYQKNSQVALAARQTAAAGISVSPGEAVSFLVCDARHPDPGLRVCIAPLVRPETPYDLEHYLQLLCRAAETILFPLGYRAEEIRGMLGAAAHTKEWPRPAPRQRRKPAAAGGREGGRLF